MYICVGDGAILHMAIMAAAQWTACREVPWVYRTRR